MTTEETLKQLEEEHKKAMEAIKAFNQEAKELNKTIDSVLGR